MARSYRGLFTFGDGCWLRIWGFLSVSSPPRSSAPTSIAFCSQYHVLTPCPLPLLLFCPRRCPVPCAVRLRVGGPLFGLFVFGSFSLPLPRVPPPLCSVVSLHKMLPDFVQMLSATWWPHVWRALFGLTVFARQLLGEYGCFQDSLRVECFFLLEKAVRKYVFS